MILVMYMYIVQAYFHVLRYKDNIKEYEQSCVSNPIFDTLLHYTLVLSTRREKTLWMWQLYSHRNGTNGSDEEGIPKILKWQSGKME